MRGDHNTITSHELTFVLELYCDVLQLEKMVLERSVKTLDFVIFAFTAVLGLILILLFFWYSSSTSSKSSKVKFFVY